MDCIFFPETDKGKFGFEALDPVVECGDRDLDSEFTLHGGLGLGEGVAKVEVDMR